MTHALTLGSLRLTESLPDNEHDFVFNVVADRFSMGNADPVRAVVLSLLADGDLVRTTRFGNREVSFDVEITGPDLASVAQGEAALRREVGRGNALTWQAPDTFAVPSVFDVVYSSMSQTFNDLDELRRKRTFTLTLTCAPFARSQSAVTVAAIAPPSTETPTTATLNNADTTSGWSASVTNRDGSGNLVSAGATVTDAGDGVNVAGSGVELSITCSLAGAPVTISATPFVVIETSGDLPDSITFGTVNGAHGLPVAAAYATPAGTVRYFFDVGSKSVAVNSVTFLYGSSDPYVAQTWAVTVYDISATDTLPTVNSHQTARIIAGRGTERAPASIAVSPGAAGTSLGWTIVHTAPAAKGGNSPALRQYRTLGNPLFGDIATMSGEYEEVTSSPVVAQVPLPSIPEGEYALLALMRSSVAGSFKINWQARTLLPGIGYLGGTSGTATAKFDAIDTWTLVPLDVVTLPPVRANGAFVQLDLSRVTTGESIDLDEWWALRLGDDCATTVLYTNAGYLWLDSPDLGSPVPRVWVGGDGDRSDAHHPSYNLCSQGAHILHPDGTAIFVATSGMDRPNVSATFFPRWHSNAAE